MPTERPHVRDFREYLHVVRQRKALIAGIAVALTAIALIFSLAEVPQYRASADILLKARVSETLFDQLNNAPAKSQDQVATEIQLLRSKSVRDAVRRKLGSAPPISARRIGQTDVVRISSVHSNKKSAAVIANEYATQFIAFRRRQAVTDLLAAGSEIERKITDLQRQINTETDEVRRSALIDQQSGFKQQFDQLQVDAALKTGGAQLVDPATVPTKPFKPTPIRTGAYAAIVGLVLGLGVAFLRDYLDDSVRNKDQVERASHGLPVIAAIPFVKSWKERDLPTVVSRDAPSSPPAEAYLTLRTAIQFMGLDRSMKTIQITSPSPGEGKTTTLANVAIAFARAGLRVAVVDCDIRRPRVHQFFDLPNTVGFTSLLLGEATIGQAFQAVPWEPKIRVLASGPIAPNPSELLGSPRTVQILAGLQEISDVVLIDSPPILPVTDAAVLARRVDATFVVVTAGYTTRRDISASLSMLRQVDAPLNGIILNGVVSDSGYGYDYGYGYGYGHNYEYGQEPPSKAEKRRWKARAEATEPNLVP